MKLNVLLVKFFYFSLLRGLRCLVNLLETEVEMRALWAGRRGCMCRCLSTCHSFDYGKIGLSCTADFGIRNKDQAPSTCSFIWPSLPCPGLHGPGRQAHTFCSEAGLQAQQPTQKTTHSSRPSPGLLPQLCPNLQLPSLNKPPQTVLVSFPPPFSFTEINLKNGFSFSALAIYWSPLGVWLFFFF